MSAEFVPQTTEPVHEAFQENILNNLHCQAAGDGRGCAGPAQLQRLEDVLGTAEAEDDT